MNNKLCFKDIPAADIDVNSLRESTLNRKASRGVKIRTVNKWYLGKPSKSGFNKYLEEIVPPDYHEDAQIFTESLDFDRRGEEPSFTFEDIKRSSRKIRESLDESNIDEYEDISQRVQDAFVSYLENNRGIIKKYFKKSKIDVNSLSSEFFNSICTDVSL